MNKYVIDDNMLTIWRTGCVRAALNDPNDSCNGCEHFDKSRGFCNFGDDDIQKMFQSNPLSELLEKKMEGV